MILIDGAHHAVDSSEMAFRLAAIGALKQGWSPLHNRYDEVMVTVPDRL